MPTSPPTLSAWFLDIMQMKGSQALQPAPSPSTTTPLLTKHCDPDADLALISADNYLFATHRYKLQRVSSVFRALLAEDSTEKDPQGRHVIRLTDSQCESEDHISTFLSLVEGECSWKASFPSDTAIQGTLDFATKYECPLIQQAIMRYISQMVAHSSWDARQAGRQFAMAARMDDRLLCGEIIRRAIGVANEHGPHGALPTLETFPAFGLLDPLRMTEACAVRIPFKYYWALVRARGSISVPPEWTESSYNLESPLERGVFGQQQFYVFLDGGDPCKNDDSHFDNDYATERQGSKEQVRVHK